MIKLEDITILYNKMDNEYCAIDNDSLVIDGYLHDTFNDYGQKLSNYDAGDYTFGNCDCDFDKELEEAIRNEFGNLKNASFYFNRDGIFDCDIDLSDRQIFEINNFITKFADENEYFTTATYFNYWDGSNFKSIVIDCELFDYEQTFEIADDVTDEIYDDFSDAELIEERTGIRIYEGKKYKHTTSIWMNNPFIFESKEK